MYRTLLHLRTCNVPHNAPLRDLSVYNGGDGQTLLLLSLALSAFVGFVSWLVERGVRAHAHTLQAASDNALQKSTTPLSLYNCIYPPPSLRSP